MGIKPRNFQILFLILSLGSVIISSVVFFVFAYQIGSDSIKEETMRTVGVAADGKYNNLSNRLSFQKHLLDNLLTFEMDICGDGTPKQVESCIKNSIIQFCKIQKMQSLYFEKSNPKMILQLGKPSRELVFDQSLKEGQMARFYDGGKPNPYYVMQSESADKKSRIVVEISINKIDAIFTGWNLGKNGESFMVDPQGFFLTTHKYHVTSGINHPIDAKPMVMCLGGKSGETVGLDYAGVPIIHGFRYIPEIGGGCIMVHIDQREAFAGLDTFTRKWAAVAMILWAVLGIISYLISKKLADQLKKNLDAVEEAGRKLRESEGRLTALVNGLEETLFFLDASGKVIIANKTGAKRLNKTASELIGLDIFSIFPPEVAAARRNKFQEALDTSATVRFEDKRDGRYYHNSFYPVMGFNGGGIASIAVLGYDITDKRIAEDLLIKSEANLKGVLDNSPVPMGIINHQRRTVHLNRKFTEIFGYTITDIPTMEDIWPTLFSTLLSGEETKAEWDRRSGTTLLEGVQFAPLEAELADKHGKQLTVVINMAFMNGQALVVFQDITGQKEAERRIRDSENLFRALFENSPIGATLHLAEGPCVMANAAVAANTGDTREHLLRQNFRALDAWRKSGMLDGALKALDSGNTVRFEFNPVTSSGKNIVIDAQFTPISINGKQHLLSLFNDISHLRDAQEKMRMAKEEAEEATRLKDKFIVLLSHDMKTPLVGILGMMQLLRKQPEIGGENQHMLDLAVQSNKRMIRMIDQLLDINRIRAGKLQLKCHYCNASDIIKKAVKTVDLVAAEKGITIQNLVPDKAMVIADPVFLEQVFCNLLTNAIKFSGQGKAVTIKFPPGEDLVFTIEDDGVGIAPDLMKNLFSYHEKTSTRGTQGEIGTGFGLPLSRDIMEALNGKLKAESRPEGGTSLSVILPKPTPNLLVMENSPGSCDGLKVLLEMEGFAVTVSPHALRVLEMLEEKRFDFLLVQLSVAKDTGSELIHLVTGNEKLKGMPILTIGDSKCYKRISDNDPDAVIECGIETSTVIAAIYSMLMDDGQVKKE